jgi:hypothetical protein
MTRISGVGSQVQLRSYERAALRLSSQMVAGSHCEFKVEPVSAQVSGQ